MRRLSWKIALALLLSMCASVFVLADCNTECPPDISGVLINRQRCAAPVVTNPSTPGPGGGGCDSPVTDLTAAQYTAAGQDPTPGLPAGSRNVSWHKIRCVATPPGAADQCTGTAWQNPNPGACVDPTGTPAEIALYINKHCQSDSQPGVVTIKKVNLACAGNDGYFIKYKKAAPDENWYYWWSVPFSCNCTGSPAMGADETTANVCNCRQCGPYTAPGH